MTRAHEVDSATRWGRHLAAVADSIFAQFGSGPRRSLRRSAERPARAAWAALRLLADVAIGATMELGRSWRTLLMMMLLLRPHGAGELRGHRQQAALKDQRFRVDHQGLGIRMISQDFQKQATGYGVTTAQILYRRPDHPWLLQTYVWQAYDLCPEFPELQGFLEFWQKSLEGVLHSVTVAHSRLIKPAEIKPVDGLFRLH